MIALLLAFLLWAVSAADAAEVLWSLDYDGNQDLTALYGWENIVSVNNAGVVYVGNGPTGVQSVPGRGTVTVAPPQSWCDAVVTKLREQTPKPKRVFLDWENLAEVSTANYQTINTEYQAYLACMRAAATPGEFLFGFFDYIPSGHGFKQTEHQQGPSGGSWGQLQSDNLELHPLAASVDFFTLAFYYPRVSLNIGDWDRLMTNLARQARLMAVLIGQPAKPVYCWTYHRYSEADTVHIPLDRYEWTIRRAHELCDAVIVWDWNNRTWSTETALSWWGLQTSRALKPLWRKF